MPTFNDPAAAFRNELEALHRRVAELETIEGECQRLKEEMAGHQAQYKAMLKAQTAALNQANERLQDEMAERRHTEARLQAQVSFLETLIDTIPAPIFYKDGHGVYLGCNTAFAGQILGLPRQAIIGRSLADLADVVPADLAAVYQQQDSRLLEQPGSQSYETQVRCADGRRRDFIFHKATFNNAANQAAGIIGVMLDITERKETEAALRQREERLRAIFDNAAVGIAVVDRRGCFQQFNNQLLTLLGYTAEELAGLCAADITHPEDVEDSQFLLQNLFQGQLARYRVEKRYRCKDGTTIWGDLSVTPIYDETGEVETAIAVAIDLTERKRTEQALQTNKQKLSSILDALTDVLYSVSTKDFSLLHLNPAAETLYGRPLADFYRNPRLYQEATHPDDRRLIEQAADEVMRRGYGEYTYRIVRPDGEIRWVLDRSKFIAGENGQPPRIDCLITDITEQKHIEEALKASEERFRQLAETIEEVFWLRETGSRRIIYISPAYETIWGRSCASLYERPESFVEAVHPEDRAQVMAGMQGLSQGKMFNKEYRIVRPDGSIRWVWARTFPIRDEAGQVYRMAGLAADVTDRKQLEAALRRQALTFENMFDAVILTDAAGRITDWNPAAVRIFGYSRAEMLGQSPEVIHHPAERPDLQTQIDRVIYKGDHWIGEVKFAHKNGAVGVCEVVVAPVSDERGTIIATLGFNRDITAAKQLEEAVRASEKRYRSLVEQVSDGILIVDQAGIIRFANPAAATLFERETSALTGQDFGFPVLAGQMSELDVFRPNEPAAIAEMRVTGIEWAGEPAYLVSLRNITTRKQAEVEREKLIAELQAALSQVKQLSGLLPICASCKKIRDDEGYWHQVEVYIRDHAHVEFSHSICPDCMVKLYPKEQYPYLYDEG